MKQHYLEFFKPGRVVMKVGSAPQPADEEVLVKTRYSAISPGTEMLIYRGLWPTSVSLDSTIDALAGSFNYPLTYGYSTVGRIIATGSAVAKDWCGLRVFAFSPHQDLFCCNPEILHPIPEDIDDETALFLPSMETAVNLLLDGKPLIGEKVIIIGQGIIGLLTTSLLSRFPLANLVTIESHQLRRKMSLEFGATECIDPEDTTFTTRVNDDRGTGGEADLVYELTGNPVALNTALALTRYSGRVIIGSWYGSKKGALDLGSFFHRGRVSLISSQVSSISPELLGKWDNARRLDLAWEMLRHVHPLDCITHRFPLADAPLAYRLIDKSPEKTIQVILDHQRTDTM